MKKFAVITSDRASIICFEDIIEDAKPIISLSDIHILERKTDKDFPFPSHLQIGTVMKANIVFFEDYDSAKLYYDLNFAN